MTTSVTANFAPKRARDVPLFVAGLPIFSRAYYAAKPFDESTLDVPLGSGAYKVGRFEPGRFIEYERVKDWWGADLPVARGQNNFDIVRFEYYRDRDVGFEGFSAGNYLFREEFTSRTWATRYDFPAVKDGRVKRRRCPTTRRRARKGWFINTRRRKIRRSAAARSAQRRLRFRMDQQDHHVRRLRPHRLGVSELRHDGGGQPGAEELALLEPFRGRVPDEVFGEPYVPPVSDGSGQDRALLRKASQLLTTAGCVIKDGKRVLPNGEPITIEFLIDEPTFEPHHMPFIKNLATLGIDATVAHRRSGAIPRAARRLRFRHHRRPVQLFRDARRFAALVLFLAGGGAEGLEQSRRHRRSGDRCADRRHHRRPTRPALVTACRALDRVIRAGRYWIPHWYKPSHWIAYWDVFGRPAAQPRYFRGIPETWWYDPDKAAKIQRAG
jgi:microcin C transport system substrate-binding protein